MDTPPASLLYRLATAHYVSHALHAVAALGVAEQLTDRPRSAEELAAATGTHAPSLRRVMRLLVTEGVFVEQDDGRFSSTPLSETLAGGFADAVQVFAGSMVHRPWGDLLETIRTGDNAFERVYGQGPFEYLADRPEEGERFDRTMASFTRWIAIGVAKAYDFSELRRVIDIGGGEGAMMTGVVRAHHHLEGAVFDLPRVGAAARAHIAAAEVEARCEFVGGDFFEAVPAGYDAYLIKHVIHDWDDERATRILARIREAIGDADARLLLVEGLYPAKVDASFVAAGAARNDCNMMVVTGGRQRTEAELAALYERAGFTLSRVIPTDAGASIIEGIPVR
ncbi:methyltransferase [Enhygromyxa salina]|uniref:Multifunctional cyclase-dehydratase-3-O-methyl transferase TcmN n=1 Tax=Enhygromyxa salina TaxID=215803 RepID=A0A2S9YT12_9BACT|nr:methyltransferase [Enhygromyxa salina]PRQ08200.1 Multifunctional cyclase-dehydratase-3-O-methyl transferase TcmN [Enhygromyxa salina]